MTTDNMPEISLKEVMLDPFSKTDEGRILIAIALDTHSKFPNLRSPILFFRKPD